MATQSCNAESSQDSHSNDSSESFFLPLSGAGFSRLGAENKLVSGRSKQLFVSHADSQDNHFRNDYGRFPDILNDMDLLHDYDRINGFLRASPSKDVSDGHESLFDMEETQDQVFSPPLLMDTSLLTDSYEDLLGKQAFSHSQP